MTYSALIERLEKEGGSRELDAEIMRSLNQLPAGEYLSHYEPIPWEQQQAMMRNRAPRVEAANPVFKLAPHPYTTSLDAAIALCERVTADKFGDFVLIGVHRDRHKYPFTEPKDQYKWTGWIRLHAQDAIEGEALGNPATALCIALLRALQETGEDGK